MNSDADWPLVLRAGLPVTSYAVLISACTGESWQQGTRTSRPSLYDRDKDPVSHLSCLGPRSWLAKQGLKKMVHPRGATIRSHAVFNRSQTSPKDPSRHAATGQVMQRGVQPNPISALLPHARISAAENRSRTRKARRVGGDLQQTCRHSIRRE